MQTHLRKRQKGNKACGKRHKAKAFSMRAARKPNGLLQTKS